MLDALANDVELALEGLGVGDAGGPADEDLVDDRLDRARARSDGGVVGGHPPPAEDGLPLFSHHRLEHGAAAGGLARVAGQEDEAGPVVTGGGQGEAEPAALAREEGVRHLDEDARAVPGVDLAAAGAAVEEILEHLESLVHDGVGLSALHVHDEADTARVVLVGGIIEALGRRHPGRRRHCRAVLHDHALLLSSSGPCEASEQPWIE